MHAVKMDTCHFSWVTDVQNFHLDFIVGGLIPEILQDLCCFISYICSSDAG